MKTGNKKRRSFDLDPAFFWDYDAMDLDKAYKSIIGRIIEHGSQNDIDKIVEFYTYKKVVKAIRDEIHFLPNYAIHKALEFFPELKRE